MKTSTLVVIGGLTVAAIGIGAAMAGEEEPGVKIPKLPRLTKKDKEESLALLDECDPLDEGTWREGTVCMQVEGIWVLWPAQVPRPEAGVGASPGPRQVVVSPDYQDVEIGESWPIAVLDAYLEDARQEDRLLVVKSAPPLVEAFVLDPMLFLGGDRVSDPVAELRAGHDVGVAIYMALSTVGCPASILTLGLATLETAIREIFGEKIGVEYELAMQLAAVAAIGEFSRTHRVRVDGQSVMISDLPPLPGPQRLRKYIAEYVVGFMSRTFE